MTQQPIHIRDLSIEELGKLVAGSGEPPYRAHQLSDWLYKKLATDFESMSNVPKSIREEWSKQYVVSAATVVAEQSSELDGTRKFLFELADGSRVESVMMPYEDRTTLCVSSQVGCPLDCVFCETAKGGFGRNLSAGEILDQVAALKLAAGLADKKVNIVFMGMGEPLLNLAAVTASVRTLNDAAGFDLGSRRITVSTSSFPDRIRELADSGVRCSLALSLNAPDDEKRQQLMPKASRFPIAELLEAARYFVSVAGRRATLEYVMLEGFNTTDSDADLLGRLVHNTPFKLNLIPYNPGRRSTEDDLFSPVGEQRINRFVSRLLPYAPTVTVRRSRGVDIDAACGQLWTKNLS